MAVIDKKVVMLDDLDNITVGLNASGKVAVKGTAPAGSVENHVLKFSGVGVTAQPTDTNQDRRAYMRLKNGMGIIHLDFKVKVAVTDKQIKEIATLPATAPVPSDLMEAQTHDGGGVYIEANSRKVMCTNLKAGTRYIVNIPVFVG